MSVRVKASPAPTEAVVAKLSTLDRFLPVWIGGDACPIFPGKRYLDWDLEDPAGQGLEAVRPIRDEIKSPRAEAAVRAPGRPEPRTGGQPFGADSAGRTRPLLFREPLEQHVDREVLMPDHVLADGSSTGSGRVESSAPRGRNGLPARG
jgi:hypothetical protein